MRLEQLDPTPPWLEGVNDLTGPGRPLATVWLSLLAAATSSPAALRAALVLCARQLEAAGLNAELEKAHAIRRAIRLDARDGKVERLHELLADPRPTLVFTKYASTVLYLRDRSAYRLPAWLTHRLAGWGHLSLPRERVETWFAAGSPEIAPRVLIATTSAMTRSFERIRRQIDYDRHHLAVIELHD